MKTPTLTEARRALLELTSMTPSYAPECNALFGVIAVYLDAQVPLNIENPVFMSQHRDPLSISDIAASADSKSADGLTLHFKTKEQADAAALEIIDHYNREMDGFRTLNVNEMYGKIAFNANLPKAFIGPDYQMPTYEQLKETLDKLMGVSELPVKVPPK